MPVEDRERGPHQAMGEVVYGSLATDAQVLRTGGVQFDILHQVAAGIQDLNPRVAVEVVLAGGDRLELLVDLGAVGHSLIKLRSAELAMQEGLDAAAWVVAQTMPIAGPYRVYSPSLSIPQHTGARLGLEQVERALRPIQVAVLPVDQDTDAIHRGEFLHVGQGAHRLGGARRVRARLVPLALADHHGAVHVELLVAGDAPDVGSHVVAVGEDLLRLEDVIAEFSHQVRSSGHVNQRSGVSVRLSIANLETLMASAVRRAIRSGEPEAVPRVCDLGSLIQSTMGRVEFEGFEEGREEEILTRLLAQAVLAIFRERLMGFDFSDLLERFDTGMEIQSGDLVAATDLVSQTDGFDPSDLLLRLGLRGESPGDAAAALEFALEGLHLTRRLNKSSHRYAS